MAKTKYVIKGLHKTSGNWVRLGVTEIEMTQEQAQDLTRTMLKDAEDGGLHEFVTSAYRGQAFDAFQADPVRLLFATPKASE